MATPQQMPPVPQWYLEQYDGGTLIGVCSMLIALETICLGLRYYARRFTSSSLGWEELLLPIAWVLNVGLCALCINAVYAAGVGHHLIAVVETNPMDMVAWGKSLVGLEWLYLACNALPKIYMAILYLKLFTGRALRMTCYGLIALIVAIWFSFTVASATKCTPFAYQWDKTIPGGHCNNIEAFYESTSVPNIITDLIILVLPIPTVLKLKASPLRKFGLLVVFLAGSIGLITSIIRLSIFFRNDAFTDNTWESVPLMTTSCVEPGMYLIAACLVTLRPLLQKIPFSSLRSKVGSRLGYKSRSGYKSSGSGRSDGTVGTYQKDSMHSNKNSWERSRGDSFVSFPPHPAVPPKAHFAPMNTNVMNPNMTVAFEQKIIVEDDSMSESLASRCYSPEGVPDIEAARHMMAYEEERESRS